MFKVKNPMIGALSITIDGEVVNIPGGEEVLLKDSVGRKLQEMQPQLECTYVEAEPEKPKKEKPKGDEKPKGANKVADKKDGKK